MSLAGLQGIPPQSVVQDDSQIEPLSPAMFSRVREIGTSGLSHEIEIHSQATGPSDDDGNSHLDAACSLLIVLGIENNTTRMLIDGKIENLFLSGEEDTTNRIYSIQMLATLLSHIQEFCQGREIVHLSISLLEDHPLWLRDFFTITGFSRCSHVKSEDLGHGYKACLKLGSPVTTVQLTAKQASDDTSKANDKKANENKIEQEKETITAVNHSTTTSGSSQATQFFPKEDSSKTQASEWLSQNQKILSPTTASVSKNPPAYGVVPHQPTPVKNMPALENGIVNKGDDKAGGKRKRSEANPGAIDTESAERGARDRRDYGENGGILSDKQGIHHEEQRPKSKLSKFPAARYSFTKADRAAKPTNANRERSASNASITDALMAKCNEATQLTSTTHIKKETPPSGPALSPPSDVRSYRPHHNLPARSLTCFYWATQGSCRHRDEDCLHAHYDTGTVAHAPPSYKYSKHRPSFRSGQYDGPGDQWSEVNGLSIKGLHDGSERVNGSAPTGPKADLGAGARFWEGYDSYRPHEDQSTYQR